MARKVGDECWMTKDDWYGPSRVMVTAVYRHKHPNFPHGVVTSYRLKALEDVVNWKGQTVQVKGGSLTVGHGLLRNNLTKWGRERRTKLLQALNELENGG